MPVKGEGTVIDPDMRVLLLPGWLGSGSAHWQSRWEAQHGYERVQQADWSWPRRGDWMARLEEVLLANARPAWLVAHSLGCHLVAAGAAHSQNSARVLGALLIAPPDLSRADLPRATSALVAAGAPAPAPWLATGALQPRPWAQPATSTANRGWATGPEASLGYRGCSGCNA